MLRPDSKDDVQNMYYFSWFQGYLVW